MSIARYTQKVLPAFFAEAGGVIGAEQAYHALFSHHLVAGGVPLGRESCATLEGFAKGNGIGFVFLGPE